MDLWAILSRTALDWAPVGRWFWHLSSGKVFHEDIGKAPIDMNWPWGGSATMLSCRILLIVFTGPSWLAAPTSLPAWILGIATVGVGWFLLQPGLGLGDTPECHPGACAQPCQPHDFCAPCSGASHALEREEKCEAVFRRSSAPI